MYTSASHRSGWPSRIGSLPCHCHPCVWHSIQTIHFNAKPASVSLLSDFSLPPHVFVRSMSTNINFKKQHQEDKRRRKRQRKKKTEIARYKWMMGHDLGLPIINQRYILFLLRVILFCFLFNKRGRQSKKHKLHHLYFKKKECRLVPLHVPFRFVCLPGQSKDDVSKSG